MSKVWRLGVVVLLAGTVLTAGGCSKKAKTAKQAIVNLYRAVETNDQELFLGTIDLPDKEPAKAMFEMWVETSLLDRELEARYGQWWLQSDLPRLVRLPSAKEVEENVQVNEQGDEATTTIHGFEGDRLVRKGGCWYVDFSSWMEPRGEYRTKEIERNKRDASEAKKARAKVGKQGYTAERILLEMHNETRDDGAP